MSVNVDLMVTLWPSFPHFAKFAHDPRLSGIRLNSAMMSSPDLDRELEVIRSVAPTVPLYFDVKGRQLRVVEVVEDPDYLSFRVNHPVDVPTPTPILFKAGTDAGLLATVTEGGYRLTFSRNPQWRVRPGESIHIKHPELRVGGPIYTEVEKEKIAKVVASGLVSRWFLSYVEAKEDLDEFLALVPNPEEVFLKIESKRGLLYAHDQCWDRPSNVRLVAACGDLFVEVDAPHDILSAVQVVLNADSRALVGSRLFLSVCRGPSTYLQGQVTRLAEKYPEASRAVLELLRDSASPKDPDFADFAQLGWLYDQGARSFMLCDELCLSDAHLSLAVNAFDAWRRTYFHSGSPREP